VTVAFFLGLATTLTVLGASATALSLILLQNLRQLTFFPAPEPPEGSAREVFLTGLDLPATGRCKVDAQEQKTMVIHELAKQTGVPAKTIRYYESIGLLPRPKRAANNYRQYAPSEAERLRFIASARSLGFSLADVAEILAARDGGIAPCQRVLDAIGRQLTAIDRRIADLLALRESLQHLQTEGAILPRDDVRGEHCICYLIKTYRENGQVKIERGELFGA